MITAKQQLHCLFSHASLLDIQRYYKIHKNLFLKYLKSKLNGSHFEVINAIWSQNYITPGFTEMPLNGNNNITTL